MSNEKYVFSGHESFQCRGFWLKKGYDFTNSGQVFSTNDAVVKLGVGKNMVASIRYWMKAFGIMTNEDIITDFGRSLLDDEGWDPYLEDKASMWLLHYQLIATRYSALYNIIFNDLRKEKIEFSRKHSVEYIKNYLKNSSINMPNISDNTLGNDFDVFTKMYLNSSKEDIDIDDSFSNILSDLGLLKRHKREKNDYYIIENTNRSIPVEVILYIILKKAGNSLSIHMDELENGYNNIGNVFALNKSCIYNYLERIAELYPEQVVLTNSFGIIELQFIEIINPISVLNSYFSYNDVN